MHANDSATLSKTIAHDSRRAGKPTGPGGSNYQAAIAWRSRGYNVVPQKAADKKCPGVRWAALQHRLVSHAEIIQWKTRFTNGVGFITGAVSGVIVIETDGPEGEELLEAFERAKGLLPETLIIRSGSGRGLHRHFKHPGRRVPTRANPGIKVDVKGDGGFCVLPPSRHKCGGFYQIVQDAPVAALPDGLLEFIEDKAAEAKGDKRRVRNAPQAAERGQGVYERLPINRTNVAIVQSMLDALPDEYAREYDLWLRVGFALHSFDEGKVGLALWERFSLKCPEKAEGADFATLWAGFGRNYQGTKISLGWLRHHATACGWRAPCAWDRSTELAA